MATTNIGQVSIVPMGAFNLGTTYKRLSVVTYNGSSYIAKVENTNKPITDTTVWYLLASKGDKGDTYEVTPEDLQAIADQITSDASSAFNVHVTEKTTEFDNHVTSKTGDFDTNASNKTTTFNNNATDKTTAFNNNASNKTTDFNTNASDKTTAFNSNASDKVDYYNANADEVITMNEQLLDQIPTVNVEGTIIKVTDSSNLPIADVQFKGNAYQLQTTGKNLANTSDGAWSKGSYDSSGEPTTNTYNCRGVNLIACEPNTAYTVSTAFSVYTLRLHEFDENQDFISTSSESDATSCTITTGANTHYINWSMNWNNTNSVTQDRITSTQVMLEQGSTASAYEPYSGGVAVPSPTSPQSISVVTGDNTVKVIGKNLFDTSTMRSSTLGITITVANDGTISLDGTKTGTNNPAWSNDISLPAGTYTFSISNTTQFKIKTEYKYVGDDTRRYGPALGEASSLNSTFTFTKDVSSLHIYSDGISADTAVSTSFKYQIEKGDTATTFEKYQGQTQLLSLGTMELAKIRDYQDYIYKSDGKWYLHKEIAKIVLDGTENWANQSLNNGSKVYAVPKSIFAGATTIAYGSMNLLSDYFVIAKTANTYIGNFAVGNSAVIFCKDSNEDVEAFKTWLSSNNVTVYYLRTTPQITEITDTTLKGQLDNLLAMKTNRNITNMFTVTDNETPTLAVLYRQDLTTLFNNLTSAILSLGNNT